MPVCGRLAEIIAKKTDIRFEHLSIPIGEGDHQLFQQITNGYRQNANEMQQAGWRTRDGIGLTRAIDDYLDIHRSDQLATYGLSNSPPCLWLRHNESAS